MGTMADSGSHRNYRKSTRWCANLFFCFFSSSMKITRSIFRPARHKDHPFSLSSSLTRRLTSNGSLKGAQSPFPTNVSSKKRRGAALDNPEPSSPKVTCIGQVRVKSKKKKHARKLRTPSRRRSGGGADESFRRMDNWGSADLNSKQTSFTGNRHRNQRWVHLPLTICEGLKCWGASSCFSSSREKSIRLDLEEGTEIGRERFEANLADAAIDHVEEEEPEEEEEEEEGRMSISVPPKNALLLMRSRSDPMRVAALSRRLLESPLPNSNADDMNLEDEKETHVDLITPVDVEGGEINAEERNEQSEEAAVMEDEENTEHFEEDDSVMDEEEIEEDSEMGSTMEEEDEKEISADSLSASENEDEEKLIEEDEEMLIEEEAREPVPVRLDSDSESDEDLEKESTKEMETVKVKATSERAVGSEAESESHTSDTTANIIEESGDGAISVLPDCLLLMMREPKVSMEVSKETWVCSTDFKRILPERRRPAGNKTLPDAEEPKNKRGDGSLTLARPPKPALKQQQQPQAARSSCSLPGPISAVQKLPRCKSEPRTAAAKLMPSETCMWKSRKVEQLRQGTVGVGPTAGVGF